MWSLVADGSAAPAFKLIVGLIAFWLILAKLDKI